MIIFFLSVALSFRELHVLWNEESHKNFEMTDEEIILSANSSLMSVAKELTYIREIRFLLSKENIEYFEMGIALFGPRSASITFVKIFWVKTFEYTYIMMERQLVYLLLQRSATTIDSAD